MTFNARDCYNGTMENKILVIDCETGGLNPSKHSLLTLAGVFLDVENGKISDSFDLLIREPSLSVELEAMQVNKLDLNHIISHGKTPTEAVAEIIESVRYIEWPILLGGHNVGFDISFLKRLFDLAGKPVGYFGDIFSHRSIDTASIVQLLKLNGTLPVDTLANLDSLLKLVNISDENLKQNVRHTAIGDARLTALALGKLLSKIRYDR